MKPSGAHTHPEMGGGGRRLLLIVVAIVVLVIAKAAAHAVSTGLHVLGEFLEILGIIIASGVGLAVLAGIALLAFKVRNHVRSTWTPAPPRLVTRQAAEPVTPSTDLTELQRRIARMEALLSGRRNADIKALWLSAPNERQTIDRDREVSG